MEYSVVPRAGHLLQKWGENLHFNLHWNGKATLTHHYTKQYMWSPSLTHAGSCSGLSYFKGEEWRSNVFTLEPVRGIMFLNYKHHQAQQHADHSHWAQFIVKKHKTSLWSWKINFKLSSFTVLLKRYLFKSYVFDKEVVWYHGVWVLLTSCPDLDPKS